ncbi:GTP-binding protein [Nocardioides aequoreus]|uniref:GTP-binding protein n=1 Tax=Nocardioides aequoreus TaxID=397278 RepID=UPI0004C3259A|nr:GTP-binding protein [Nocardioides aequoreus]
MRTPVVLVTGVDPDAMAATMVGLQFDLPHAVAVQHRIDPERSELTRVVSDLSGVVEREVIDLAHACVTCAIREDVLPTLERLAADGRWSTVLAHLPVGAEAAQVCHVLALDTVLARRLRVSAVLAAVEGPGVEDDLLGDDLLAERGRHSSEDDRRGLGEVAAAMVEHADLVVTHGTASPAATELLAALARPGVEVVEGTEHLEPTALVADLHRHDRTQAWVAPVRAAELPLTRFEHEWRLDLVSPMPFHPHRLLDDIERLGTGRHRSRGCFWLPTRPDRVCTWDGAGGQLSIGNTEPWGRRTPLTRIVLTGLGRPPFELADAFRSMLLSHDEAVADDRWQTTYDGLEPWLGPIPDAA